jgi:hypothetical protein
VLRSSSCVLTVFLLASSASLQAATPVATSRADQASWPRQYTVDGTQLSLYRPELESWSGNQLQARAVMAVKTGTATDSSGKAVDRNSYGVVWLKARTDTDKQGRLVTLNNVSVTKTNFPAAADRQTQYQGLLQSAMQDKAVTVSLDQLESALAVANSKQTTAQVQVNNTPPEIIFSFTPAVLVPIDGEPVWRSSGTAGLDKVINTKAVLLRYQGRYYLGYADHWASSSALDKGWTAAATVPAPLQQAMQAAEAANRVPSREALPPGFAAAFEKGKFPVVYVRTHPAELISVNGDPEFTAIAGTSLSYVSNTAADVFVDGSADHNWYVLVSGRWFSGASSNGPWHYVAANSLPADFAKIPTDSPKGAVLASISGTPQAREAIIANAVPQTATVDKSRLSFQARYDGAPQFKPLAGTRNLSYAVNSATPIIDVPGHSYYALDKGVWFVSETSPQGPWTVAVSVPADIYAIPASSPLHYVTYAQVYGSSGNNVYVGYTPGYYGTVVSNGTVVYGTGYPCDSWVGTDWYGCPATYGYGAALAFGAAVGWGIAFGWGWDYPWYNPWWGPWGGYYPGYYPWAYGGAAAWNVYGRWGNSVVAGTRAAWANPWTGNYGRGGAGGFYNPYTGSRGYGYAGRNVNAYTGRSTAAAGGIRYNPQTGRVVAGRGAAVGNIYSGNGAAGGARTAVNTNTGRVTNSVGGLSRGPAGATAAGAFNTMGAGGDAKGGGYVHYNRATGDVNRGGVVDVNGNMYAGRDGNVYRNSGDGWEKMGGDNRFARSQPAAGLDNDRLARSRGFEREGSVSNFGRAGGFGAGGGRFANGGGGFGGGHFAGGFRGGGMHGFRR